jgi:sirohydrochlorin cobaltochelatase
MKNFKTALLIISFGTSYKETRKKTIEGTEKHLSDNFKDFELRRAFTSGRIIKKLKERDGIEVDNVKEAMERLKNEGFKRVYAQPLHVINGFEFDDLEKVILTYKEDFEVLKIGRPLLTSHDDYLDVVEAVKPIIPKIEKNAAVVFMGHGTDHDAGAVYPCLDYIFKDILSKNIHVGVVEGYPEIEVVERKLKEDEVKKVTLIPMMVVAGDHALNDMVGDDEDSWKSILENKGYTVDYKLIGLGELIGIRDIYKRHLQDIIK